MQPFVRLTSTAVALMEDNIDTDVIFPARFLLLLGRAGMGQHLFADRRFTPDGLRREDFVLNRKGAAGAQILIAGASFGCGSSREQAVWALADHGFRCVIAPSFGEIFSENCFRNSVLPLSWPAVTVAALAREAQAGSGFSVDLESNILTAGDAITLDIQVPPDKRAALLSGLDETETILQRDGARIRAFEQRHRSQQPWLFE